MLLTIKYDIIREGLKGVRQIEAASVAAALSLPRADREAIRVIVTGAQERIGAEEMDGLPNLGLIVAVGAGHDGVDSAAAQARGVGISSGSGLNADDVADVAVALFLALSREILVNDNYVRSGEWKGRSLRRVRSVGAYKAGIVAMGPIGKAIATRLAAFRCEIAWTGPRPKPDVAYEYVPDVLELARRSDVLMVAAPLNPESAGMIDARVIEALGPQGLLVNVGRGALVDEDALIDALKAGRLGGAGLDVFVQEPTPAERWAGVPNTVLSPHLAGVTTESMTAMLQRAARAAADFVRG